MLTKPKSNLRPNTAEFEVVPHVMPTGFREYDARWRFPEEISTLGFQALGMGLGTLLRERASDLPLSWGMTIAATQARLKAH